MPRDISFWSDTAFYQSLFCLLFDHKIIIFKTFCYFFKIIYKDLDAFIHFKKSKIWNQEFAMHCVWIFESYNLKSFTEILFRKNLCVLFHFNSCFNFINTSRNYLINKINFYFLQIKPSMSIYLKSLSSILTHFNPSWKHSTCKSLTEKVWFLKLHIFRLNITIV